MSLSTKHLLPAGGKFPDGGGVGGAQNLGEGSGVVDVGEGGVVEVSVIGVDGLGGGDVSVDGRGRKGGSDEASMTSDILCGSEDDLLGTPVATEASC
jgi:hypothetical protein